MAILAYGKTQNGDIYCGDKHCCIPYNKFFSHLYHFLELPSVVFFVFFMQKTINGTFCFCFGDLVTVDGVSNDMARYSALLYIKL